jgi:hypothetical protein
MKFDGFNFGVLVFFCGLAILAGTLTYDAQQQRVTFQQTYNKNLECRQSLKGQTMARVNEICGPVPVIGDFVK